MLSSIPMETLIVLSIYIGIIGACIGTIFLIRYIKNRRPPPSFSSQGLDIYLSPSFSLLSPEEVNEWLISTIEFWVEKRSYMRELILNRLGGLKIVLVDADILISQQMAFNGLFFPDEYKVEIATYINGIPSLEKVKSLFRHEVSHAILFSMEGTVDVYQHHQIFLELGLGA